MEKEKKLYMYVYRMILSDIYNGKYSLNDKLPSLPQLCEQYNVGRNTVRSALLQLQDDGYVIAKRGVQAIVTFDLSCFETQLKYKQSIKDSEEMIKNIYKTMDMLLPDICLVCLKNMSPAQFQELENKTNNFSIDNIKTENELIQELYNIYLYAFSVLDSPLLNDLFLTFMYSIYQPLIKEEKASNTFKRNIKTIQKTLRFLLKCAKSHNDFMVKNLVSIMCKSNSKLSQRYITRLCKDMETHDQKQFIWISDRNQEHLYMKLILRIIRDIQKQVYKKGETLPSIAKISLKYEVSEKTTRKVLELLREVRIIETINGVGSKVIIDNHYKESYLFKSPTIKENMKGIYDSLNLLSLIFPIIIPESIKSLNKEDIMAMKKDMELEAYSPLEYFYDYVATSYNRCLYTILDELKCSMGWNIFISGVITYSQVDFKEAQNALLDAMMEKDVEKVTEIISLLFQSSLNCISKNI